MDREIDSAVLKRRMVRRIVSGVVVLTTVVILLAALPGWLSPSLQRARIRTAPVVRGRIEATVQASGTVRPAFEKVLSSPVESRVLRILIRPGAEVLPGDPVLELDTSATRLELDRLQEKSAQKENEKERLRLDLEKTLADLSSKAQTAQLDVEILDYRVAQNRRLHEQDLIADTVLREVEVEARKAKIQLAQIEASVASERKSSGARMEGLSLDLGILRKEIEEARRLLDGATVRADRAGVLTWVIEEEGTTVRKGDVIARIADLDSFRVEGNVSDVHAPSLATGQPVHVILDDLRLAGEIKTIHPTINNGVITFEVRLAIAGHDALRNNLRVDVLVVTDAHENVLKVERFPHARGGTLQSAFVVHGDRAERREVRVGLSGYDEFEILEGLEEGDEVIVTDMSDYLHMDDVKIR